ncbi:hypothetical protein QTP88_022226 [Uroleucon formosanum]
MNVDIRIPRVTKTQCHRVNAQSQSTDLSEFYHINYFLPYLDYLMSELNSRFHKNNDSVIYSFKLIIPKYYFVCETSDGKILNAAQTYEADLPHSIEALHGELNLWKQFWKNKSEKADSSMEAFKYASMSTWSFKALKNRRGNELYLFTTSAGHVQSQKSQERFERKTNNFLMGKL